MGLSSRWSALLDTSAWRNSSLVTYVTSLFGGLHTGSLVGALFCVAFAGYYVGLYQGVHQPGYDLFRPELFFIIVASCCLLITSLLMASVLMPSGVSQQLIFNTLAPQIGFAGMTGLWIVAGIAYMTEIVRRNQGYEIYEWGFSLKIFTSLLALGEFAVNLALLLLSRQRYVQSVPGLDRRVSLDVAVSRRGSSVHSVALYESTVYERTESTPQLRLQRAPSSPPFFGKDSPQFPFDDPDRRNSESVKRLTERTLTHSISLNTQQPAEFTAADSVPEYAVVNKPRRPADSSVRRPADPVRKPPVPPAPPSARKKPVRLVAGGAQRVRAMRRSVSSPEDVDTAVGSGSVALKFTSTDHLDRGANGSGNGGGAEEPSNLSFKQRLLLLQNRQDT